MENMVNFYDLVFKRVEPNNGAEAFENTLKLFYLFRKNFPSSIHEGSLAKTKRLEMFR